jgi:osmoprotectant transport system permease protein
MGWLADVLAWFGDQQNWQGPNGIPQRLLEHVGLSAAALGIACALTIPVGLWLGHIHRGGALAVGVSNIGRAVPTFAVLVLLVLAPEPFGLSTLSILTALVLFAIPPILTNTYIGVREVDPAAVDAARGMGMNGPQILAKVELPLATALLMDGVRLAAVQVVATATIAALVAGGGLGAIITDGYGRQNQAEIIGGSVCVVVLALSVEVGMALLQRRVDSLRTVRERSRTATA